MTRDFAVGMIWLVFIATFLAYAVYYTSLRLFPVAKVSAAIYLSPPVTMIWAWLLFSEPLTVAMFGGLVVTLVGVWITSRSSPGRKPKGALPGQAQCGEASYKQMVSTSTHNQTTRAT
jgi:drug/metabolite transporter (DMT)-like permease